MFTAYDAGLFTSARYGAFPTETTWYVAAGDWPSAMTSVDLKNARHFRYRRTQFLNPNGTLNIVDDPKAANDTGYQAQIAKVWCVCVCVKREGRF